MPNLIAAVILPAAERLGLTVFTAEESAVVLVPMPAPEPGTTGITFTLIPNDDANDVVVEAPLFCVPPARRTALSVYFATVASRYKGVTWMIHDGMAYASVHVDLDYAADGPAMVAAAFERLTHALGYCYAEITRLAVGAPVRRSRAEREAESIVAPLDEDDGASAEAA